MMSITNKIEEKAPKKNFPTWKHVLNRVSLLLALNTMLVVFLSYYAGYFVSMQYHFAAPPIAGLWSVISGIVVLQQSFDTLSSAAWLRISASLLGALTSYFAIIIFGYNILALTVCVFFIVILSSLFNIKDKFRIACITAAVIIIVGIVGDLPAATNCASRFLESVLGTLIAVYISRLFFPLEKKVQQ